MSYVTQYPVPPIFSFPLEGKSREAGKGVRGRVPIGCSIAILTANRRPPERSDAQQTHFEGAERRTNHSESFPLWGATFLHNPWHQGPEARWMPYAPLRRRRRPLREYWKAPPKSRSRSRPRRKAPEPSSPTGLVHLNLHAPISRAAFLLTTSLTCIRHAGIM